MIISEKQLVCLIQVLRDSMPIDDGFVISQKQRLDLYQRIVNQQSEELKVIE